MELFGIALSLPVALVATLLYSVAVRAAALRWPRLRSVLRWASVLVLLGLAIELVLLACFGAVGSRSRIGPSFYVAHLAVFFLGTPALANLLVLQTRLRLLALPYVACIPCAVFALFLTVLQYGVSEALYGVNGMDGPLSRGSGHLAHGRSHATASRLHPRPNATSPQRIAAQRGRPP